MQMLTSEPGSRGPDVTPDPSAVVFELASAYVLADGVPVAAKVEKA
jgi:hypothetical protein